MRYGQVPGIEKPISRIVQGMMQVPEEEEKGFALLDVGFEAGINTMDTAIVYGKKDAFLGRWIQSRGLRDKVVVLAKGAHHNDVRKRVTPFDIQADLHDILARMQTDYVDLFMLHRDDPSVPVEPIVDVLNACVRAGKIKAFGGSNWTTERLEAANRYATASGQIPFAASSPQFSLATQLREPWADCVAISGPQNEAARQWYAAQKMPIFTWSSMAGGFMSGRFTPDNLDTFTGYFDKIVATCYASPENFERLERARRLASDKGLSLPQIALAYVLSYPLDIFALVGSATPEEVRANVQAVNTRLTAEEMAYLDLRQEALPVVSS